MLDYRAHKLYWLISLPVRVIFTIGAWTVLIFCSFYIAHDTSFIKPIKFIIAPVAVIVITTPMLLLSKAIHYSFFWMIDVIPAHGTNVEEARSIVLHGRLFELSRKLETAIEAWKDEDTRELISLLSWRRRYLFKKTTSKRVTRSIQELKNIYVKTGKRIKVGFGSNEAYDILERIGIKPSWAEQIIVSDTSLGLLIIILLTSLVIGFGG